MIAIKGAKAGKEKPRKPSISKDTVSSVSTVKVLYGLAEGEIAGLVNGGKSIFLDGTPLLDDNGAENFAGVKWDFRAGTNDQDPIAGFPDVSNETGINVELKSGTPWVKAFTNTELSAIRVRFKWNQLSQTNAENGDVKGYRIDYAIDLQTDGGVYQEVVNAKIEDKTSAGYERTHRIDLPKANSGWQIRVRRITPNSTSDLIRDTMSIAAVAEVIDVKLAYPNTAHMGISYNGELFGSIAKFSALIRGKIIRVPSNYNASTRKYTGIWNGTFKDAYSNNPAWIYYDLCTQWRYGLGERINANMIDKWSIYKLGQYCDELVSDGKGGLEPRFTCNVYIQSRMDAYEALNYIAGIFSAMSFWDGEKIVLDADIPQDPVYTFTRANVVADDRNICFNYSGTRQRDRHTLVKVAWNNPANNYDVEHTYVRDEKAMSKIGVKVLDLSAFGCTSESQAQRLGLRALKTEQLETQQVTFSTGLEGANVQVGNVINISDQDFAGRVNGGRVSAITSNATVIKLDRDTIVKAGDTLIINGSNGINERRIVKLVSGRNITVASRFLYAEVEHVWGVESVELALMRFRIIAIKKNDDRTFSITALQHEPKKFPAIDFGADVRPDDISVIPIGVIEPPAAVTITSRHRIVQGQTVATLIIGWTQVKTAVAYEVEWRKDDGTWIKVPRTGNVSVEIDGVYNGNYMARVRSVSAFDVQSLPTTSLLTEVKGKIGLPSPIAGLVVKGVLFGFNLSWFFGVGSADAAYTEIEVGNKPSGGGEVPTTTVRKSNNLFDASTATNDFVSTTGVVAAGGTYYLSDFIPVIPTGRYTITGGGAGKDAFINTAHYDASKKFIRRVNTYNRSSPVLAVTIPADTSFIRFNIDGVPSEADRMFNVGTAALPYEKFGTITENSGKTGDANVSVLGQYSYPTDTAKITGLQGGLTQSFRARLVDKLGFKSEWSHWVKGTTEDSVAVMLDILNGKLTSSQLDIDLRTEIEKITDNTAQISQETQDRIQAIVDAEAGFVQKITEVKEDNEYQYTLIDQAIARTDANVAGVQREVTTNTNKVGALSQTVNTVVAKADANTAAIAKTDKAVADTNQSIAESKTEILAEFNGMEVGGHNLIAKSVFDNNYLNSYGKGNHYLLADKTATGGIRVDSNSVEPNATFGFIFFGSDAKKISLRAGVEYTLSFYGQSTLSSLNYCYIMRDGMPNIGLPSIPVSSGYNTQRSITFTLDEDVTNGYLLIATRGKQGDWFALNGLMLQRGNKPTAWGKSPLDFDDAIGKNTAAIVRTDKAVADAKESIATTKTELQADYRKLTGNNAAAIKQESTARANDIGSLAETINTVQSVVKNQEIGGDNLIPDSTFESGYSEFGAASVYRYVASEYETPLIKVTCTEADKYFGIAQTIPNRTMSVLAGQEYTLSFFGQATFAVMNYAYLMSSSKPNQFLGYIQMGSGLRNKKSLTFIPNVDLDDAYILIGATGKLKDDWFTFGGLQVQKGNVATAWKPSGKELVASIQETKKAVDGLYAQWTMKLDVNGYVGGLTGGNDGREIDFILRTDAFTLAPPSGNGNNINSPFTFRTTTANINGTIFPVGAYLKAAFIDALSVDTGHIKNLAVKSAQIDNLAVTTGKIADLSVDTIKIKDEAVTIPRGRLLGGTVTKRFNTGYTDNEVGVSTAYVDLVVFDVYSENNAFLVSLDVEKATTNIDFGKVVVGDRTVSLQILSGSKVIRDFRIWTANKGEDINLSKYLRSGLIVDQAPKGLVTYKVRAKISPHWWEYDKVDIVVTNLSFSLLGAKK